MRYGALAVGRRLVGRPEQALAERLTRWIEDPKAAVAPGAPSFRADLLRATDLFPAAAPGFLAEFAAARGTEGWKDALDFVDHLDAARRLPFLRRLLDVPDFWSDEPARPGDLAPKPLRVSDRAAVRVATLRPDLPFDPAAMQHERDARIRALCAALDGSPP